MVEFAQNTGNPELEEYWAYGLKSLDILQHHGMSEEEDAEEDITTAGGVDTKRIVRIVKVLGFRHELFRKLFVTIDGTPGLEDLIFRQSGRPRIPRKRVDTIDYRSPPKGLPESVFCQEYLNNLSPYQKEDLEFSAENFEIRE